MLPLWKTKLKNAMKTGVGSACFLGSVTDPSEEDWTIEDEQCQKIGGRV
jgi:hypothetical protein